MFLLQTSNLNNRLTHMLLENSCVHPQGIIHKLMQSSQPHEIYKSKLYWKYKMNVVWF